VHTASPATTPLRRAFSNRHPGDALRVVLGVAILITTATVVHHDSVGTVETNVFRLVNDFPLPAWSYPVVWALMQFGNIASVPAVVAAAGFARRWRLALDFAVAGGTIYVLAKVVKTLIERGRPQTLLDSVHILGEPARGLGYVSGHSAVAVALATVAAPYLGRNARRWVWAAAVSVCVFRLYVGAHLPLDVVGGMALGWAAGAAAHLILGAPEGHVSLKRVRRALEHLGFPVVDVQPVATPTRRSASFRATTDFGPDLFVKVSARERRDDDILYRAWRALRRRWIGPSHTGSAVRQVEHEACMGAMAAAAGVRTPAVLFAGSVGNGAGVLVQRWVDGVRLDEVEGGGDDALVERVWTQLDLLHAAGLAHGDLHAASILVDDAMRPWLVDFSMAEAAAGEASQGEDIVTVRDTLASLGPRRPRRPVEVAAPRR
jgi:membrane-associated phospholipid phosphatase/predicted Ser/Thr protein kinase